MSGREWKPGDVAMVHMRHGPTVAIWTGEFWAWSDGRGPFEGVSRCHPSVPARPLVLIDPEDREQVERLRGPIADLVSLAQLREALDGFANPKPPKPDEPQGLGAVVEDADGEPWVRFQTKSGWWWRNKQGMNHRFGTVDAVRVLSEGVQP